MTVIASSSTPPLPTTEPSVECDVPAAQGITEAEAYRYGNPTTPPIESRLIGAKLEHARLYGEHVDALFTLKDTEAGAQAGEPTSAEIALLGQYHGKPVHTLPRDLRRELQDIQARLDGWNRHQEARRQAAETKRRYLEHAATRDMAEAEHRAELALQKARDDADRERRAAAQREQDREARILEQLEAMKRERLAAHARTTHVGADEFITDPRVTDQNRSTK